MTTKTKPLPPLPREVQLPAGPYRVIRAEIPHEPNQKPTEANWGKCDYESRTITVRPGISRAVAHLTLEHETVHAVLFDAGVRLSELREEAVCDAIANHRVFEMNHR